MRIALNFGATNVEAIERMDFGCHAVGIPGSLGIAGYARYRQRGNRV
jgi:hypothetical protein